MKTAEEHYWEIHEEITNLHKKKGADYGSDTDPFANLRAASEIGLSSWKGVMLRILDKVHRLKAFCKKGVLANESVEDSFLDLANYSMLALALFREEHSNDTE